MRKFNIIRIFRIFIDNFIKTETLILSNDLTYVSLFAIFPFFAIILGLSKGFGLDVVLIDKIKYIIPDNNTVSYLFEITKNLLEDASSNLLSGLGIIIILSSVITLQLKIKKAFNIIWHVEDRDNYFRMLLVYIAIVFLTPIFLVLVLATNDILISFVEQYVNISSLVLLFAKFIKFFSLFIMFTIIYSITPDTKVSMRASIISSLIVVISIYIFGDIYRFLQKSITRYNAIYGSLAFIPLFLLWIKYLWVIILSGAQIAYSTDTNYSSENTVSLSIRNKKSISLYLLYYIIKNFEDDNIAYNIETLSEKSGIKEYAVRICLDKLYNMGYISYAQVSDEDIRIQLAKNPNNIKVSDFNNKFEDNKQNDDEIFLSEEAKNKFHNLTSVLSINNNELISNLKE